MKTMLTPLLFLLAFNFLHFAFAQNATSVQVTGTNSTNTISNNVASIVDPNLSISANGTINGFVVTITDSYVSGDQLDYTATLPVGITASPFNSFTHSLVFSGTTTAANWEVILRTVRLITTSVQCNPESRKVTFIAGDVNYNPLNNHFYKVYHTVTTWSNAKAYASTQSYFGMEGYLATITSQAENSFIFALMNTDSWIGCSDNYAQINAATGTTTYSSQTNAEGHWFWVTGPERGTNINNTNACTGSTAISPVSNVFNRWSSSEPNDYPSCASTPGQEDYGHIWGGSGYWNDYPNSSNIKSIIEFGDMPGDNVTSQVLFTRNIYINGAVSGTIQGGYVTVCPGSNSTTLNLVGLTGTVVKWQYSYDNFITPGVDISNTTTTLTATNLTQTTYYRAIVNTTSGCISLAVSSTVIYVGASNPGNIVADNTTICAGGSVNLTVFGNSGTITQWERSTTSNFSSGVTVISNTNTLLNTSIGTTGTYYFRALIQYGTCSSSYTSGVSIVVNSGTPPVGGTVSIGEHCVTGSFSGSLSLSGYTGSIQKWQYSTDGGVIWTDVSNTSSTLNYSNVSSTRKYRVFLTNGSCGSAYSSAGEVIVYGNTMTKWIGNTSTDWGTASNWCGGVADNAIDALITVGSTYDLVLDQNRSVGSLNFNGANHTITLNGATLTASELIGGNASNRFITNGQGKIKVFVNQNDSVNFPVSNSSYNPVAIKNKTGYADYFSVRVFDDVYTDGYTGSTIASDHVNRTWDISKVNLNSGNGVDFTFNWNPGETTGIIDQPTLNHHNGTSWEIGSGAGVGSNNQLVWENYTGSFSPFAIGNNKTSALPITLDYFNGDCSASTIKLAWRTLSEINSEIYQIEKAQDNYSWIKVADLPAGGNSQVALSYEWIDPQLSRGLNYYRLIQRDFDGKETIYGPISVACELDDLSIEVFPNPTRDKFNLQVESRTKSELLLHIESAQGQFVLVRSIDLKVGANSIPIPTNGWSEGVYLIRIQLEGKLVTKKVVVQH